MSTEFDLEFTEVEVPPVVAAQIPAECGPDPTAIAGAMQTAFGSLMALVQQQSLGCSGPPRAIYTSYGPQGVKFLVAMPVAAAGGPAGSGPGFVGTLPGGKALRFTHHGPYRELMKTYGQITQFMLAKGLMKTEADWARYMPMWEEYVNDPQTTPEDQLLTHIYLPAA